MKRRAQGLLWGLSVAAGIFAGMACGVGENGGAASEFTTNPVVLFHTSQGLMASSTSDQRARVKVEDFYPAVCLDRDDDGDGIPNSVDPSHSDDDDVIDGDDDGGSDGGSDRSRADAGSRSDDHSSRRCHRQCNRGPGTSGDFRLRVRGAAAELERGTVHAFVNNQITVASPEGIIRINVLPGTRIDDGPVSVGAEIRVEGTLQGTPAERTINAERLRILCPGPATISSAELPEGAQPVPATDGVTPRDGGSGKQNRESCEIGSDCASANCATDPVSETRQCAVGGWGTACSTQADCGTELVCGEQGRCLANIN